MRSQPPIRLLHIVAIALGGLALLAFSVALSAPRGDPGTPIVEVSPAFRQASPTPDETVHLLPATASSRPSGPRIQYTLVDGGQAIGLASDAPTVGEALAQAGIVLYLADRIQPPIEARLTPGLTVVIDRSQPVVIEVDGDTLRTRVSPDAETVADALAEAGIALLDQDYTLPSAGSPLPPEGVILVKRALDQSAIVTEAIPFEARYEARADMELDTLATIQEGQDGVLQRTYYIRYEDGVEVERQVDSEVVLQPPVDKVIGYGTNIVIRTLDTVDGPVQYWRKIFVRVTAYSPSRSGTPTEVPWFGRTRTGKTLVRGIVAVDPTVIPLGAKLYVVGYGPGTADDTGSGIVGKWVDLGYEDSNFEHWYGYTDVYLLAPPPPPDQINWILP